jgi:hypothetical protein
MDRTSFEKDLDLEEKRQKRGFSNAGKILSLSTRIRNLNADEHFESQAGFETMEDGNLPSLASLDHLSDADDQPKSQTPPRKRRPS